MDYLSLFALTLLVRGLGAGMILGVGLLTNPVQKKMDFAAYLAFIKTYYKGAGVKFYALLTGAGLALLITLFLEGHAQNVSPAALSVIQRALIATLLGFVGTAGAFPTMQKLWATSNTDFTASRRLLRRFEAWQWVSTVSHLVAFGVLIAGIKTIVVL